MPRIPAASYYPTVDANPQPFRSDTSVLSPELASIPGHQEQQAGQAMLSAGSAAVRIATDMQDQINQARVLDARNQLQQFKLVLADDPKEGYLSKTGLAALKPEDGKSLSDVYLDKFEQQRSQVMAGLDNDRQRTLLTPHAADIGLSIQADTQRHALDQFKSYQISNLDGQLKLAADGAERSWQDPDAVTKNLMQAQSAVANAGTLQGKAPTEIAANIKAAASTVHAKVIEAALANNNPSYANLYYQSHKDAKYDEHGGLIDGGMTADDILRVNGTMNRHLDGQIAMQSVAATVKKFTTQFAPTNMDQLQSIVLHIESGGRDLGDDGKPLTSTAGAKYAMQVMPATAADPGHGIKAAANDSPAEYNRVGRELLGKLVEKYGDVPHALAAYNYGEGHVDAAIKDKGAAWITVMPKETQDYVRKGTQQFASGQTQVQMPTEQEFISDAVARLGASPRPEQILLTQQQAEHQFGIITKSLKAQADQSYNNVLRAVIGNGGDFSQVAPSLKMDLARRDPDKYDDAIKVATRISNEVKEADPTASNTSIFHPERLAAMSDGEFQKWQIDNFPKSDWESVAKRRDDYLSGKVDLSQGGVNHKVLDRVIKERMLNIGVDPANVNKDPKTKFQVNAVQTYLSQAVLDQQKQLDRRMSEDEITKLVDTTFAKDATFTKTFMGFDVGKTSQRLLSMSTADIPPDARDGIKRAIIASGNKNPTDGDILQMYWKLHK